MHRPARSPSSAVRAALCACAAVLLLASCRSPLGELPTGAGFELTAVVPSNAARSAGPAAGGSVGGATARLILGDVTTIRVTISSDAAAGGVLTGEAALVAGKATLAFDEVPLGPCTVEAWAYSGTFDAATAPFHQSSSASVTSAGLESSGQAAGALCLVPRKTGDVPEADMGVELASLPAGECRTWFLPPGSPMLEAANVLVAGLGGDVQAFLQSEDGVRLASGSCLSTAALSSGKGAYLTLYNTSATAKAGLSFCAGMRMVEVPAGSFQRDATATNISEVSAFSLGAYEVTRAQFLAVMGTDPSAVAYSTGSSDPVQVVNWYRAVAFCNKLSLLEGLMPVYAVTGVDFAALTYGAIPTSDDVTWNAVTADLSANGYRLPTEMEWMWAAMGAPADGQHGGTDTAGYSKAFSGSTGSNAIGDHAWTSDNSSSTTHPAGTKLPNELGLYDMSGNVREWLWDWYEASYPAGALLDYQGGSASGGLRVYRGGGFTDTSTPCSVGSRTNGAPSAWFGQLGFRVARGSLPTYAVSYDANGATGGSAPASVGIASGQTYTVSGNSGDLVRTEFGMTLAFTGWNTASDGSGTAYAAGSVASSVAGAMTLYAQWSALGQTGPGGGLVFYQKAARSDGWQYLEADLTDLVSTGAGINWSTDTASFINGSSALPTGFGMGWSNTLAVIAQNSGAASAALVCRQSTRGGKSDWFLPSKDELHAMFAYRGTLSFGGGSYWSSSESLADSVWTQAFLVSDVQQAELKQSLKGVRAARRF